MARKKEHPRHSKTSNDAKYNYFTFLYKPGNPVNIIYKPGNFMNIILNLCVLHKAGHLVNTILSLCVPYKLVII